MLLVVFVLSSNDSEEQYDNWRGLFGGWFVVGYWRPNAQRVATQCNVNMSSFCPVCFS